LVHAQSLFLYSVSPEAYLTPPTFSDYPCQITTWLGCTGRRDCWSVPIMVSTYTWGLVSQCFSGFRVPFQSLWSACLVRDSFPLCEIYLVFSTFYELVTTTFFPIGSIFRDVGPMCTLLPLPTCSVYPLGLTFLAIYIWPRSQPLHKTAAFFLGFITPTYFIFIPCFDIKTDVINPSWILWF
jgi:hypothetical protein